MLRAWGHKGRGMNTAYNFVPLVLAGVCMFTAHKNYLQRDWISLWGMVFVAFVMVQLFGGLLPLRVVP